MLRLHVYMHACNLVLIHTSPNMSKITPLLHVQARTRAWSNFKNYSKITPLLQFVSAVVAISK